MNKILIIVVVTAVIVAAGLGLYFINKGPGTTPEPVTPGTASTTPQTATSTSPAVSVGPVEVIGQSIDKRDITAYHFGSGTTEILFIGGIHGGYAWNTVLVANQLIDYLKQNPDAVPANLRVTVIPVLNPDGLSKVVGTSTGFTAKDVSTLQAKLVAGRFNANTVDLNRNFDCDWQAAGTWQSKKVSGGASAFSEPETVALKSYVEKNAPTAVVAWYSAAGGVYASNCHGGVLPETTSITSAYAKASGYPAHADFNFYELTGDMINWFAKNKIPAISVLLTNHTDSEWSKNKAGVEAVLKYYAK